MMRLHDGSLSGIMPDGGRRKMRGDDENFIVYEYAKNMNYAIMAHREKLKQIYQARMLAKQMMTEEVDSRNVNYDAPGGNNSGSIEQRSRYVHPIGRAIIMKILSDLTAYPASFEYDVISGDPELTKAVFEMEMLILKQFTEKRNVQQLSMAITNYVESGTLIAEPFIYRVSDGRYAIKNGEFDVSMKNDEIGDYALSFNVYDPLRTLIDPSASPGRVPDTAGWCIVTLGRWSAERIMREFGVVIGEERRGDRSVVYSMSQPSIYGGKEPDIYSREVDIASGYDDSGGFLVRKYLRAHDGMEFIVVDDGFVVEKKVNRLGIYGRLWLTWAPIIIDTNSPYGTPLLTELQPSIEVISTIFNQVCDINARNMRAPLFVFRGLIDFSSMTTNTPFQNDIVEIVPSQYQMSPGFQFDIEKLMKRFTIPALDNDSMFIYNQALSAIWFLTGLNPTVLSGYQDKQIRVSGVADMLQSTSLRNTSIIVKNFETMFLNPIASEFHWIVSNFPEKFPTLFDRGVNPEHLRRVGQIRVINGSYLPADQTNKLQKAYLLRQDAATNRTLDPVRVLRYFYQQFGINLERFERDPLELLTEEQIIALYRIVASGKQDELISYIKQAAEQIATRDKQ